MRCNYRKLYDIDHFLIDYFIKFMHITLYSLEAFRKKSLHGI